MYKGNNRNRPPQTITQSWWDFVWLRLQKLSDIVHTFCEHSGYDQIHSDLAISMAKTTFTLAKHVAKTKFMVSSTFKSKSQRSIVYYEVESIEVVHSFTQLGVERPCLHTWNRCLSRRTEASTVQCYKLASVCHLSANERWEIRAIVCDACIAQTL